ncbi:MAG TPA: menaquinone biosynthesis protein [Verrucomicrobiae bacterium]|nr:menaquinone biosynthesis protein [Verrucomicrobiae bacterium]
MKMGGLKTLVRIGKISYINCLPFYHRLFEGAAWKASAYELYEAYPTKVNLAMRKGKVDLAPISSLEYLNHADQYMLLPDLAIGARDFSGSVLLFSKVPIEKLDGETILLTRQSLSSATLLRVLMKFKFKFKNEFISSQAGPDEALSKCKAALVIGDEALFYAPDEFVYKYDLSELWWNWTEKPFCFAVWAVRRDFAQAHPEEVALILKDLRESRDRNLTDLEGLLKEAMNITFLDPKFPKVYGYFFNLNFHLDEGVMEGLELFYRLAQRLGVSPKAKKIEFFKEV